MVETLEYPEYIVQLDAHVSVAERSIKMAEDYAKSLFEGRFEIFSVVARLESLRSGEISSYLVKLKLGFSVKARSKEKAESYARIQFEGRFNIDSISAEETASEQEG